MTTIPPLARGVADYVAAFDLTSIAVTRDRRVIVTRDPAGANSAMVVSGERSRPAHPWCPEGRRYPDRSPRAWRADHRASRRHATRRRIDRPDRCRPRRGAAVRHHELFQCRVPAAGAKPRAGEVEAL